MTEITYEGLAGPRPAGAAGGPAGPVSKTYGKGASAVTALHEVSITLPRRQLHRGDGPVGVGQEHAAAVRRRAGPADRRARCCIGGTDLTGLTETAADPAAPRPGRVRVPGVQPAAVADRGAERGAAAAAGRAARPTGAGLPAVLDQVGLGDRAGTGPASCPAASSSGWRSPGRWSPGRRWSSPTSRPARWTPRTGREVLGAAAGRRGRAGQTVVMVTHDPVAAALRRPGGVPRRRPLRRRADRPDRGGRVAERMTRLGGVSVMLDIAIGTVRARKGAFAGAFLALLLATTLVTPVGFCWRPACAPASPPSGTPPRRWSSPAPSGSQRPMLRAVGRQPPAAGTGAGRRRAGQPDPAGRRRGRRRRRGELPGARGDRLGRGCRSPGPTRDDAPGGSWARVGSRPR